MFFKTKNKKTLEELADKIEKLSAFVKNQNEISNVLISKVNESSSVKSSEEVIKTENKNLINYEDAESIQLNNEDRSEIIEFLKCMPANIDDGKKYRIITADAGMNLLSNTLAGSLTGATIKALNPHLYRSAVEAGKLMHFHAGGVGSAIMGKTGIVGQAPFFAAEATVFAPMIIMQVLSMITAQYYLNGITKQLNEIRKDILQLKNFKYMEDASKLESIRLSINELLEKEFVSESDLSFIRTNRRDSMAICLEYSTYLKEIAEEDLELGRHLTEKGFLNDIYQTTGKTNVNYYANLINASQNITFMTYAAELYVYSKLNKRNCVRDIKTLRDKLKTFGEKEKNLNLEFVKQFYNHCEGVIGEHRAKNVKKYEKGELNELLEKFNEQKENCIKSIEESEPKKEKEAIIQLFDRKLETLIFIDSNGRRALLQEDVA